MWAIATEQVADDGVIEEKFSCSTINRLIDTAPPDAVEGLDLERLEDETQASLSEESE
jgi:hypothetical protein